MRLFLLCLFRALRLLIRLTRRLRLFFKLRLLLLGALAELFCRAGEVERDLDLAELNDLDRDLDCDCDFLTADACCFGEPLLTDLDLERD